MKILFYRASHLLIFLHVICLCFTSCADKIIANKQPDYNDSVNRQFWTADWSPDDKFIAVGGVDSLLRIYHAHTLKLHKSFQLNSWIHAVRWHPKGSLLAVATLDRYIILLNVKTGVATELDTVGGSRAIGWNHDGSLLAAADLEGEIKIWNDQGMLVNTIPRKYGPEVAGTAYIALDWHPVRNIFVATNFQINFLDTAGTLLKIVEHANKAALMLCVKWHPSGKFFVIGDYGHNWEGENVPSLLHFWQEDGKFIKSIYGSKAEYRNMAWNKAGTRLATASDILRVWSNDGKLLYNSKPDSSNYLWGIDWKHDSKRIVSASRFKTIALWDSSAMLLKRIEVGKP